MSCCSLKTGRGVPTGLPPFSFLKRVLWVALALAVGLIIAPAGGEAASTQQGYRLAGVVAVGEDYLGFLELPQGGQVLVRKGSVVNGGRVIAFDDKVLRIQFPGRIIELQLQDSGKPAPPDTRGLVATREDSVDGRYYVRRLNVDKLDQALRAESTAPTSAGKPARSDTQAVLAQRFEPLFQLPLGSKVTQINEMPVTGVDAAIKMIEHTFADHGAVRLNIQTPSGEARVYLMRYKEPKGP